ncbi:Dynein regulatory complex protein 1 [Larimichthys crocea]|uniref:Dynein regulatory complex protein 1 n=1 Tax=Larimichthys crocea TaxID=215358 RepID=A0A6G0I5J0_LARCR|nr:Dynein regulatory complex protein 1 [Larimichthys crocea]
MEEHDEDPGEASVTSVLSENQEAESGVSTQEVKEDPEKEVSEEIKEEKDKESEKLIVPQRLINLQRDLSALVTNIQTAADAKESTRRTELEETRRLRLEWLENDARSSKEKFEEISKGWSIDNQKLIAQELQEVLNNQQKLCSALVEDKKKLITTCNRS